jgi:hypothetical protein
MTAVKAMSTAINPDTLRLHIRSTLQLVNMWSCDAEELLIGTAAQESHLGYYRRQIRGPARGIYQMEPATERDIWDNYLRVRPDISDLVYAICGVDGPDQIQLERNLMYQTIMARIHYRRVSAPLPPAANLTEQARYWKRYYNTDQGRGRPSEYIENYRRFVRSD